MVSLYTDQHRQAIRTQLSRRAVPLGIFSAVMLGVVVWSLIGRHQALTIAAVILPVPFLRADRAQPYGFPGF